MNTADLTCATCQLLMLDYVEGQLSAVQRAAVQLHLARCLPCRRQQEEMSLTMRAYQAPAYQASERPSAATRMAVYEAARQYLPSKVRELWQRPVVRYALAAMVLLGISVLLRPVWQTSVVSEPPVETALSLPPPVVPPLKIEYSHVLQDFDSTKRLGWVLEGDRLQWKGETLDRGPIQPVYQVEAGDLDDLIRIARNLNVIPIPILTPEPRGCPNEDDFEVITIEFEGRRLKMRLCESESGNGTQRDFSEKFKKWTAAQTSGHYVP